MCTHARVSDRRAALSCTRNLGLVVDCTTGAAVVDALILAFVVAAIGGGVGVRSVVRTELTPSVAPSVAPAVTPAVPFVAAGGIDMGV